MEKKFEQTYFGKVNDLKDFILSMPLIILCLNPGSFEHRNVKCNKY